YGNWPDPDEQQHFDLRSLPRYGGAGPLATSTREVSRPFRFGTKTKPLAKNSVPNAIFAHGEQAVTCCSLKIRGLFFGQGIAHQATVTLKVQAQEKIIDPRFLRVKFSPLRHIC